MNLLVIGKARAGKDTLADYLVEKYGFKKYNFSDILRDRIIAKGLEPTKEEMIKEGMKIRQEYGSQSALAQLLLKKINKKENNVITGAREPTEEQILRKEIPDLKIILVEAKEEHRHKRSGKTLEELRKRDKHDLEVLGLKHILQKADFVIENNSSLEEYYKKIDELLAKINF